MEIKILDGKDLKEINEIIKYKYSENNYDYNITNFLKNESSFVIYSSFNNEFCGYLIGFKLERLDNNKNMIFLYEIEVVEQFRKNGIGTNMVKFMIDSIRDQDTTKVFVITNKSNTAAMKLYEGCGFSKTSEDDVLFVKNWE